MSSLIDFQQRQDALDCSRSFIVQAPAGSGKTGVLTQRILGLLARVEKPEEVVAITFTKKAAGEMRQRVLEAIHTADNNTCPVDDYEAQTWHLCQAVIERDKLMGWNLLRHPNRLKVQTIDGFCSALVKQMPFESSMGAMPSIEEDATLIYEKAAKQLIGSLGEGEFYEGALKSLLTHLDNNYRLAVNLIAQMLDKRDHWLENLITARRHDGDLRELLEDTMQEVVMSQIKELEQCLPETIRQQLMSLALYAAHNLTLDKKVSPINAALAVENDSCFIKSPQAWAVFAELLLTKGKPSYRKRVDAKTGFPAPTSSKDPEEKKLRKQRKTDLAELIDTLESDYPDFRERLFDIKTLPLDGYSTGQWALLMDLLDLMPVAVGYLNLLWQESGNVDFTEISMAALRSLGSAEEPTDLTLKYDQRISHILVDEFQDTSVLQIQLLEKLTAGWQQGDGRTLFLVGDPMQGIYSFRKADIALFLGVWHEKRLADVVLTPLSLKTNFRSDAKVIDWVNNVFGVAFPREDNGQRGAVSYSPSVAAKSGGQGAGVKLKLFQQAFLDTTLEGATSDDFEYSDKESEYIAETVLSLRNQHKEPKSYAVLVRSKSHARSIIAEMGVRKIPVRAVDIDTLQESAVIQQLLGVTRALLRPSDRVAWYSVLRGTWVGLSLASLETLHTFNPATPLWDNLVHVVNAEKAEFTSISVEEMTRLRRVVSLYSYFYQRRKQFTVRDAVEGLWRNLGGGYFGGGIELSDDESMQGHQDAQKYFSLLEAFEDAGDLSNIKALEEKAMTLFSSPGSSDADAVQIMSMHKSKGLEFDFVFLPYAAKRGRGDDRPLLIVDNHLSPVTGERSLFLAALPERGGDTKGDAVYEFLWKTHATKLKNELSRLTYVACTRAKQQLYISGTLASDKNDEIKEPSSSTILGTLWSGLEANSLINNATPVDAEQVSHQRTKSIGVLSDTAIERLVEKQFSIFGELDISNNVICTNDEGDYEGSDTGKRAVEERSVENGIVENSVLPESSDSSNEESDDFYANVGTYAHRIYKQFGDRKSFALKHDDLDRLHVFWRASLTKLRIKADRMDEAIDIVHRAVVHLVDNPEKARWLFDQHNASYAEYGVSRCNEKGEGERFVIDRTFIDGNGKRWVVDYKFAEADGDIDQARFIQDQVSKYRDQLENYASILNDLHTHRSASENSAGQMGNGTCLMLYFPLMNRHYTWSLDTDVVEPF